jgi:hypothetical protein
VSSAAVGIVKLLPLIVTAAVIGPLLIAAEMTANCWAHGRTREACDPDGQIPELVQSVTATIFAWMANPPNG